MKCQKCDKPAIYHITELTGGKPQELHLCDDHAKVYLSDAAEPDDIASGLAATLAQEVSMGNATEELQRMDKETCAICEISFLEFRSKGRFGCPNDYTAFVKHIEPLMMNIHGSAEHVGKVPKRCGLKSGDSFRTQLIRLRREMTEAVTQEDYERASILRDKISTIENRASDV